MWRWHSVKETDILKRAGDMDPARRALVLRQHILVRNLVIHHGIFDETVTGFPSCNFRY
jgi:hypothetical protein